MKSRKNNKSINTECWNALICTALCFVTALLSFLPFLIAGHGAFTLRDDFNVQSIPFSMEMIRALQEHQLSGWTWSLDLGTSFIQGYSFYLGSPLMMMMSLFPVKMTPYLIGWTYIFKYTFAGLFSYLYFHQFVNNKKWAILGGLIYAFSGFQTTNLLFYSFHDVVAIFPLLLLGLDRLMENENKKGLFVFAVFLCALDNYYFFVGEVIFLIIYFLIRYGTKNIKLIIHRILICLICGLWGTAMAAVLFLPSALYILGNPKASSGKFFLVNLVWDSRQLLSLIRGILFPGEPMHDMSMIGRTNYKSESCWLPGVGIVFVLAYISKNKGKKDQFSKLVYAVFGLSLTPFLCSVFLLFSDVNKRWWYMLIIIFVLVSIIVLDHQENYEVHRWSGINLCILVVFYLILRFIPYTTEDGILIYHKGRIIIYLCIALMGPFFVFIWSRQGRKVDYYKLTVITSCVAVISTIVTLHFYQKGSSATVDYVDRLNAYQQLDDQDQQYRYATTNNVITNGSDIAGMGSFSSTVSNSLYEFDDLFGFYGETNRIDKNAYPGLRELVAAKYKISEEAVTDPVQTIRGNGITLYVSELEACPIGYGVRKYIREEDLLQLEVKYRGRALLSAAVISDEDEPWAAGTATREAIESFNPYKSIHSMVEENSTYAVNEFYRDRSGFSCKTNSNEDMLYYFSVPYEKGWKALIDNNPIKIVDSGGMMLIKVPAGEHFVKFNYVTPGYRAGCMISIISLLAYIIYIFYGYYKDIHKR